MSNKSRCRGKLEKKSRAGVVMLAAWLRVLVALEEVDARRYLALEMTPVNSASFTKIIKSILGHSGTIYIWHTKMRFKFFRF